MATDTALPHVEVLRLEPGDVLAVKVSADVTAEEYWETRRLVEEAVPGHEVLVYSGDLTVVRAATHDKQIG